MRQSPSPSNPHPGASQIEALLAHRQWVRALARSLVRDESSADDIEQQTWQAALENPPAKLSAARAWLGSVVRRTVLDSQRRHVRRERREAHVARSEGLESTADVVARVEIDRAVVNAVAELPEPYRTTLLLRFYDELPPRDVAARMGVPVETVRARVRRGLERVRVGLDSSHGGERETWMAALVPFLAGPGGLTPADSSADPQSAGSGSTSSGAAGAQIGVHAATLLITLAALTVGVLGGAEFASLGDVDAAAESPSSGAIAVATRARDAERQELIEVAESIRGVRAQLGDREAQLADFQHAISAVEIAAAESEAPPLNERAAFVRPFRFPRFDAALESVDWIELGQHLARMIPLLGEVHTVRTDREPLNATTVGQLQVHNGALVAVVGPLESSFPGRAANAAITHPAFTVTMLAALLDARDLPLSPAQVTALDRLAKDASNAVARAASGAAERDFLLEAVIAESEAKLEFATAMRAQLTAEQLALLGPESIRDVLGYDLFGPAQMWVGVIETGTFPAGADVSAIIGGGLSRELGLDAEQTAATKVVVGEWFATLPEEYLGQAPTPSGELESAHRTRDIVVAAQHMLDLMRRLTPLDLTAAQRESIRNSKQVIVLRRVD